MPLLTVAFTAAVFFVIYSKTEADIAGTWHKLREARLLWVVAALALSILEEVIKAYRWCWILRVLGCTLSLPEAVFLLFANLPLRGLGISHLGDVSKVAYLKRRYGVSMVTSVASLLGELALSLGSLLVLMLVGWIIGTRHEYELFTISVLGLVAFGCLVMAGRFAAGQAWLSRRAHGISKQSTREAVLKLLDGLAHCPACVGGAIGGLSLAVECGKLLSFWLLSRSLGLHVPLWMLMAFVPTVMIIAKVPVTVAGLGTREGAVVFLFRAIGDQNSLMSLGMLFSLTEYIFPMFVGLFLVSPLLMRIIVGRVVDMEEP